jgi:hypothetical protein
VNKYKNKKTIVDGITFHSKLESDRYVFLKHLQLAGVIGGLQMQVRFSICDKFKRNNKSYLQSSYIADFTYGEDGKQVVEDVKGFSTDIYELKKKLVLKKYPDIVFREVRRTGRNWQVTEL